MLSPKNTTRSPLRRAKVGWAAAWPALARTSPRARTERRVREFTHEQVTATPCARRGAGHSSPMPRLSSFRIGEGDRPTILLHGFLGAGKNLRSMAQAWAQRDPSRLFLVPDLTGHGASPPLPSHPSVYTLASDV